MKSQLVTLFLLIIVAVFFQPTHQYRLSKRQLTEYDLTNFIVGTCSADKIDVLIQNLCDQTLESALMGNFPFLTYYCKTLGAGMSYCNNMNGLMIMNENDEAKRSVYRRLVRSLNVDKKLHRKGQEMNTNIDLELKLIMQMCITKVEKSSLVTDQFCNRTLDEIQQGRYPEIKRFCKYHSVSDYCRHVRSYLPSFTRPVSKSSSSVSSTHSVVPNLDPSFVSSSIFKPSNIDATLDHEHKQRLTSS